MKVDYLIGRKVTAVADAITEEPDWDWVIIFEGDVKLGHKGNAKIPTAEIDGTALGAVEEQGAKTTMGFYGGFPATLIQEVTANTNTLTIKMPGEEVAQPITEPIDPTKDLPPDPSNLRVAEGPEKTD